MAARMSQGNQAVCAVWGVAAVANGIAMLFGADFDPTVSNIPTYLGWYVAADTTVRSCITGMQTLKRGGMVSGPVPVGLATLEIIGSYVHDDSEPEWEA